MSGLLIHSVIACKQPGKAKLFKAEKGQVHSDHISKNVYLDDQFAEDEMEVILNTIANTVTIIWTARPLNFKKVLICLITPLKMQSIGIWILTMKLLC
ncbi:hypothetical protein [Chryseobacterium sp. ISL-6]|uniref:hypothetical protein n=1 Tax=Chryseobacterium sp. ISL-6 TaxID=2819143 RepID=UPI001BE7AF6A|nr:hypothetical protein [Chryseobacterium sp. ISL-6]MBT2623686.1 hypothetical protein [Chryseobacterium sp. ISL-6]